MRPLACLLALALAGCAHSPYYDPQDPLERVNRAVHGFNEVADTIVVRPVARGYVWLVPSPVRRGIANFFDNLFYPTVLINDLLQLKFEQFAQDFARFVLNSTFGVAGIFDIATPGGLPANNEDFGQTLGYWGVGPGWYLVLPVLGPSNNRDLVGRIADYGTQPLVYLDDTVLAWGLGTLDNIETRAQLLPFDSVIRQQLDRYVFIRSIYLQRRENLVYDGNPPQEALEFDDDDFD
jgi:phospholipid-binding lipoprotein MlaA